jgi:hypothetical protein
MLAKKLRAVGQTVAGLTLQHTAIGTRLNDGEDLEFTSCALGDADASRQVWVTVSAVTEFGFNDSYTLTIGGVTATQVLIGRPNNESSSARGFIFTANVPTGTSADINLNTDGGFVSGTIAVYSGTNNSTSAADTFTTSTWSDDISLTSAAGNSTVLAVLCSRANDPTWAYSGLNSDYDPLVGFGFNSFQHFSAGEVGSGSQTFTQSGGSSDFFGLAAVVISPA